VDTEKYCPGRSPALRARLGIPDDAFVVLSVAALKKDHKRVDCLISELAGIEDRMVYLLAVGSRERDTDELVRMARDRLGSRGILLDNVPHEQMPDFYRAADLFALCSLKEMLPIALLEATASGLPCLVHRYPSQEWVIGRGGESLDMTREGELASTVMRYRRDAERRILAAKQARERAVAVFSKDVVVGQYIEMYEAVMEGEEEERQSVRTKEEGSK
jgi:glycosyltransferase involved in cell wall biosynthesis